MTIPPISLQKDEYDLLDVLKVANEPWDMSTFPSGLRQGLMRRGLIDRMENGKYFITPRGDTAHGQYVPAPATGDPMKRVLERAKSQTRTAAKPHAANRKEVSSDFTSSRRGLVDTDEDAQLEPDLEKRFDRVIQRAVSKNGYEPGHEPAAIEPPVDEPQSGVAMLITTVTPDGKVERRIEPAPALIPVDMPEAAPAAEPCAEGGQTCATDCLNRRALDLIFQKHPKMRRVLSALKDLDEALEK